MRPIHIIHLNSDIVNDIIIINCMVDDCSADIILINNIHNCNTVSWIGNLGAAMSKDRFLGISRTLFGISNYDNNIIRSN